MNAILSALTVSNPFSAILAALCGALAAYEITRNSTPPTQP